MWKRFFLTLAVVLILVLSSGTWMSASAKDGALPFKAYYPVSAAMAYNPECGCMQQIFTPGGDGLASHMGVSQFEGQADFWFTTMIQKGTGKLNAANGDYLTVYYEGTAVVIDDGAHIVADGWYTVTGGSGRFEGMTGGGTYRVFVYMSQEQPNDLWFNGTLYKK
jgi:hypothetical protein